MCAFSSYCVKYENCSLRRFLLSQSDTRWCPKPDCGFALIANDFASCPKITCKNTECATEFCYHCRQLWHPDQSCDQAHLSNFLQLRPPSSVVGQSAQSTNQQSRRTNLVFNYPFRPVQLFAQRPSSNSFSLPSLSNSDIKQASNNLFHNNLLINSFIIIKIKKEV